jgi:CRP-like cAMP-binding protein
MLGFPRSATARAAAPSRLRAYNVRDFREHVVGATAGAMSRSATQTI